MAFDAGAVKGRAILDDSQWVKGSKNVAKSTGGMTKSIFAGQLAFAAFNKAVTVVVNTVKQSITAFAKQQQVEKQLETVLKSTKNAVGLTATEIKNMAGNLQQMTTFGDEAILSGQNLLLTFTKIGKDVFPSATETMLNMSQALGQNLQQSAIQLGKALQDPIQGVTALRRVGIQLSTAQTEQIKRFVELNDIASAQKVILGELETQFGGSAAAARDTFGGALKSLKNIQGDLLESIGAYVEIIGRDFVEATIEATRSVQEFLASESVVNKFKSAWSGLQLAGEELGKSIQESVVSVVENFKEEFGDSINLSKIGEGILKKLVETFVELGQKIELAASILNFYIDMYSKLFKVISNAINVVKNFGTGLIDALDIEEKITGIKDSISGIVKTIFSFLTTVIGNLSNFISENASGIGTFFQDIIKRIGAFIKAIAQPILKFFQPIVNLVNKIINVFKDLGEKVSGFFKKTEFDAFRKSTEDLNKATEDLSESTINNLTNVIDKASDVYDPLNTATKKNTNAILDQWKKSNEELLNDFEETNSEITSNMEKENGKRKNNLEATFKEMQQIVESLMDDSKEELDRQSKEIGKTFADVMTSVLNVVADAVSNVFDLITGFFDQELDQLKVKHEAELEELEMQKERKLEQTNNAFDEQVESLEIARQNEIITEEEFNERLKLIEDQRAETTAQIEEDLSKKQIETRKKQLAKENEIEKKKFIAEKANKIAEIWIQAALGIVAAWTGSFQALAGIPIVGPALATAMAAVMTALILGTSIASTVLVGQQQFIPKKAKGGIGSGLTEINEGDRGEIVNLPDGSLVIPNDISQQIARNVGTTRNGNMINVSFKGAMISDKMSLRAISQQVIRDMGRQLREAT
jgi:phage-related protein